MGKPKVKVKKPNKPTGNPGALDAAMKLMEALTKNKAARRESKGAYITKKAAAKEKVIKAKTQQKLGQKLVDKAGVTIPVVTGQTQSTKVELAKLQAENRRREIEKWNGVINANSEPAEGTSPASSGTNSRISPAGNPAR